MLNVGRIEEGFVLDHIKAGKSMTIYHDLKLDKLDCCVAIIKNARSNKMGKKDIIKVECSVDMLDLDILGFIDHNITVNVIQNGKITSKKELHLPSQKYWTPESGGDIPLLLFYRLLPHFPTRPPRRGGLHPLPAPSFVPQKTAPWLPRPSVRHAPSGIPFPSGESRHIPLPHRRSPELFSLPDTLTIFFLLLFLQI